MQICELLLVATGTPVWEACVCLACKYFPRSVRVSYSEYVPYSSMYVWLTVSMYLCLKILCVAVSEKFYNAMRTSFYALVSYVQIFV